MRKRSSSGWTGNPRLRRIGNWGHRGIAWAARWRFAPHLAAAKSKAQFLIAIAANDDARSPNDKNVLKETFAKANLPAEIEVYAGAAHGWCPPDSQVYNEALAEKAWSRLLAACG